MLLQTALFHSFYGCIVFRCIYVLIPHLLYPFICWCTFRLLPCLSYCEQCCYEHRAARMFWIIVLPKSGIAKSYGNSVFSFLRNLHSVFHSGCTNLHSHQQSRSNPFSPQPFQHLFFVAVYMFWILTPCQSHNLQVFCPTQKVVFSFCWWFPLLSKIF